MVVYESARVALGEKSVMAIRVPDDVLGDLEKSGRVIHYAEIEFKLPIILLGTGRGGMHANPDLHRALREQQFDPEKLKWSQWNMAE
jgi:hypothetical protein